MEPSRVHCDSCGCWVPADKPTCTQCGAKVTPPVGQHEAAVRYRWAFASTADVWRPAPEIKPDPETMGTYRQ